MEGVRARARHTYTARRECCEWRESRQASVFAGDCRDLKEALQLWTVGEASRFNNHEPGLELYDKPTRYR